MPKFLITTLLCAFFWVSIAQKTTFCNELKAITTIVNKSHYRPKPLNDSLSKGVFKLFLKAIDDNNKFFTQKDIDHFKKDEYLLDDYIKTKKCDFLIPYAKTFENRIGDSKRIIESLRNQALDYSGTDSLYYNADKSYSYFKDEPAISKYWNKKIRFKILQRIVENDSILSDIKVNFKTLEKDIKQKIIDNEICLLDEILNSKGSILELLEVSFLDVFLKYQDPNSAYFSASDKNLFEQSVSNSQLSFGISTEKKKNGDIVISNIAPGSAAFKQGEFEVNDTILTLQNSKGTLETYCTSNATILSFINNANTNRITFKIKKQDGNVKSIELIKTSITIESNSITGYIIEGQTRIGYINIPSFYTNLEYSNGLGLSNDVAKQVYKLQKETIDGLIIDLRFNGGGSMKEAADLSGMFIDRGPVAITKIRNEENYTIRDPNRGTIFTKPIIVLVNQFSASASEFFAGALQDYNRAIILGSPTHGKATSQMILPVQNTKNSNFIKLTVGQFFRVTGQSHQQIGVVPDIILPNIYDDFETQESYKSFAVSANTTDVSLKHKAKPKQNIDALKSASETRTANDIVFKSIIKFNHVFVTDYIKREGRYPLNLDWLFKDITNYTTTWNKYSAILDQNEAVYTINNTASTERVLEYNTEDKSINTKYREQLTKDPYIEEAYNIINDIIKL
ncbi:S41 family peptidase [Winogradskyella sp. UBA3174]|uniref:S41 family peptidase n=1 Tax=Winogradskyella sp. UBA3174 TaxID=1947785 RepID=UPI0025E07595|nr:S41 family peptidase [Winogradskyella sp. UBA3174]|tara:strand:+ start:36345 stop:38387 length:2043 start_codon:yes stop_codon:yes gene_type:complete